MLLFFLGIVLIALGIVRLVFPNIVRSMDRFWNDWQGVQTKQGEAYELGRIISGIVMIITGFIIVIGS